MRFVPGPQAPGNADWRRWLPVALHVGAFAGAVLFGSLVGLLFAFWGEALAVSVAWLVRPSRTANEASPTAGTVASPLQSLSHLMPGRFLAAFSLFFLFAQLQFLTFFAAQESGDPFAIFDQGFVWTRQLPAIGFGILSGVALAWSGGRGKPLPSPMRKVILMHMSIVFGGVASGFLLGFGGTTILVGGILTAVRIADDLLPAGLGPRGWSAGPGAT